MPQSHFSATARPCWPSHAVREPHADGVKVKICALVVAEEQRVVLDAEREDQLRRRDEGRGVLEARLPVHPYHAEREGVMLIN